MENNWYVAGVEKNFEEFSVKKFYYKNFKEEK